MSDPFYWKRPEEYPPEQCTDEGWYQWTDRGLVYLGEKAIRLEDIDEASAAMLEAAEARAAELQAEVERLTAICQESLDWFEVASNTPLAEAVAKSMVRRLRAAIAR